VDWLGDHPFTNLKPTYAAFLAAGYYVEILRDPWTCFDAKNYHALILYDPEEAYFDEELAKIKRLVGDMI
jgi:membrane-bound transcription factor site-1 protease